MQTPKEYYALLRCGCLSEAMLAHALETLAQDRQLCLQRRARLQAQVPGPYKSIGLGRLDERRFRDEEGRHLLLRLLEPCARTLRIREESEYVFLNLEEAEELSKNPEWQVEWQEDGHARISRTLCDWFFVYKVSGRCFHLPVSQEVLEATGYDALPECGWHQEAYTKPLLAAPFMKELLALAREDRLRLLTE